MAYRKGHTRGECTNMRVPCVLIFIKWPLQSGQINNHRTWVLKFPRHAIHTHPEQPTTKNIAEHSTCMQVRTQEGGA
jgi:hypothetical protein